MEEEQTLRDGVAAMFKTMRMQRDSFRSSNGTGRSHSPEARRLMGELLDWFLVEYEQKLCALDKT